MTALENLTEINLDDLVASFGWEDFPFLAAVLRMLFRGTARRFAQMMLTFDADVGADGLGPAGKELLKKFARLVTIYGREYLPDGPVLALSNHPGMVDTLALFTALDRQDLQVIAVQRPFLEAISNTSQRLDYITEDPGESFGMVKRVRKHLDQGGAVLTFPAGKIDPDPAVYPGAIEALQQWTDSAGVFLRLSPETALLPVVVKGVIWKKTAHSFWVRLLKKEQEEREKLAVALQLIAHVDLGLHPLDVSVQFGEPIRFSPEESRDKEHVHQKLLQAITDLINTDPQGQGFRVL